MGRILGEFGDGVLEALQGFAEGVGHGYVNIFFRYFQSIVSPQYLLTDGLIVME